MRIALWFLLIPCAFLTTSCSPSATTDGGAAEGATIQALDEQWSATAAKNDLAGTVAFYADDAVLTASQRTHRYRREVDPGILGLPPRSEHGRILESFQGRSGEIRRTRISLWNILAVDPRSERGERRCMTMAN